MDAVLFDTGATRLRFSRDNGPSLDLDLAGIRLLEPASPLSLVVDGQALTGWLSLETSRSGERAVLSGPVAAGVEARLEIARVGTGAAFEFALTLRNTGSTPITVSRADGFAGRLAEGPWQGLSYTSRWGDEFQPEDFALTRSRDIEIRTGRSALGQSPWLGLTLPGKGALAIAPVWSGNWHIGLEDKAGGFGLCAGISPWKFFVSVQPGGEFAAPPVLLAAGADLEEACVALTRAVGAKLPRSAISQAMPLEWNHWWPYEDQDINEDVFLANAAIATELGFEVSTLDAGWFGSADPNTFWWDIRGDFALENTARFPHGLRWLGDETRRRGQKFGIWMEIEAVGLKAALRAEKPDIMARRDDDPPEEPLDADDPGFLGYICLGAAAGRAHVENLLDDLVAKTGCEWIKVDFNLDPKAGCSCTEHGHGAGDGLYAHYRGLYALLDAFRARHPQVLVEACASGGLRVDAGLLRHVHCAFLSDPDWTPHHLQVVHGTSRLLPPAAMLHWPMSEWRDREGRPPNQTLSLRDPALTKDIFDAIVRSGFLTRFGLSWRLPDLPEKWRARLKAHLDHYRAAIAPLVRDGDMRRLSGTPLRRGGGEAVPAFQISLDDRHAVFAFALDPVDHGLPIRPAPGGFVVKPVALAPDRRYRLRALDAGGATLGETLSGAEWMARGLPHERTASLAVLLEPA